MTDTRPDNMRVRLPKGQREHLNDLADEQGVPVNTLLTVLLTQASRWDPVPDHDDQLQRAEAER